MSLSEPSGAQPPTIASAGLRSPPPYTVRVSGLTVVAPPAAWTIPMAIPITVPKRIQTAILARSRVERPMPVELIRAVSLVVEPGNVLAIIGGSGSGKTTLLNAIACRLGNLEVASGSVSFIPRRASPLRSDSPEGGGSGKKVKQLGLEHRKGVNKIIGFVRQDDFLLPYLTVRETLTFAARLRLPASVSSENRAAIVEQTIMELGLRDAADTIVGGPFRKGISGGEKRRLSIGCILVTLPSILVCDEPTTGLDSSTAYQLLKTLSNLAKRGRTVILSIHQPRSDAFALLDRVTLLSTGSVVYSGPTSDILAHFQTQGYEPEAHVNPLDFVVDVSSVDSRDDELEIESRARVDKLVVQWQEREKTTGAWIPTFDEAYTLTAHDDLEKGIHRVTSSSSQSVNQGPERRANGFAQTMLLTSRAFKNLRRNYGQNVGMLTQAVVIGIALGLAFYKPPSTPGGIQTMKTIVYQSTPAFFYLSIIVYCWIFSADLIIFDREREDNLYATVPYAVSSFIALLPANVVPPTIYALIIYFMTGFRRDNLAVNVLSFIAQCILQQHAAVAYALLCVGINRSFASASLLANGFSIVFILTSGYLIIPVPVWISWSRWLSPYFYGFNWIARLQFTGRTFACTGVTGPARNACNGTNVLVGFRFHLASPLWIYPLGLFGFVVVTQTLATLLLAFHHPGGVKHAARAAPSEIYRSSIEAKDKEDEALLPHVERVDVKIENLRLTVNKRAIGGAGASKIILERVDALFPAGEVSVIMGPSGAGKSSLLQLLAGRLSSGALSDFHSTGDIFLNGHKLDSTTSSLIAFMEQEDKYHLPALTVRETLRYAARLSLRGHSKAQSDARAEEVLRMLGLKLCADNFVGGELLKGISGGEKRRLSLAIQLISDPAVLFADEPLSGLDAFTARNVMQTLRDIASSGRTVVVSVHQPRSDIWTQFDNVLLLVRGGRSAYSGPRSEVLKFLEAAGHPCPAYFNPADFLLDVVTINYSEDAKVTESEARVAGILKTWSEQGDAYRVKSSQEVVKNAETAGHGSSPILVALPVILSRSLKNLRRQQDAFIARLANPPFMALLFWIFFGRLNFGPAGAQNRVGLLQETTALPFVGMLSCLAIFPAEKTLFFHEWKSPARQSVTTFLMAYTVQETLSSIVSSLLLSIIFVYGMNLQQSASIFTQFWFAVFALISVGESVGIIFTAFFDNGGLAVSLVSAGITILAQLNGIISVTLPRWLQVIGWASPMKSQARIQLINEMTGLSFNCTRDEITSGACIATTGAQLLSTFGIPPSGIGKLVGILASLVVIFRLLAMGALRARVAAS